MAKSINWRRKIFCPRAKVWALRALRGSEQLPLPQYRLLYALENRGGFNGFGNCLPQLGNAGSFFGRGYE